MADMTNTPLRELLDAAGIRTEFPEIGSKFVTVRVDDLGAFVTGARELSSQLHFLLAHYIETEDGSFTFPDGVTVDGAKVRKR